MLRLLIGTAATGAFLAASLGQATFSRAATPTVAALSEPEVAARVAPSVVQVLPEDDSREGQASGVKIAEGILTNDHVVGDAERVRVVAADGRRGTAAVLSRAPALDLVLLEADLDLPAVELEGVGEQRQGETVLLLGYPQPDAVGPGEAPTLTRGLVSAIRRDHEGVTYIQTDAAVDPGSSGGAMVNLRVLGLIAGLSAIRSRSLWCCFRIEDHSLLAYLYFAVLEVASAFVDVQDGTRGGQLCVDKPEAERDRAFAEQALAGADHHRELPDVQRID
jgi:S1-C subfamily serine protease